jgi:predicted nucleotidyltransferase component of viral defense system
VTEGRVKSVAASVRAKLLRKMPELGEAQFQRLLRRFAIERFLYRLGRSPDRERFVLKGAMLLVLFGGKLARPTKDLDLLGLGALDDEELRAVVRRVCSVEVEAPDGLEFQAKELKLAPIRERAEYGGTRILLPFHMEQARDRIQIDVGLGDAIYPPAIDAVYPTLLDLPPPRIRAYRRETVIAEKTEALVKLGAANSRMKDFFDLWALADAQGLDGQELVPALRRTFERRGTALPDGEPVGLRPAFFLDPVHIVQWRSFVHDRLLEDMAPDLPTVGERLRVFLMPLLGAAATTGSGETLGNWRPDAGWPTATPRT